MAQCARQEVCSYDAREKMKRAGLSEQEQEELLKKLRVDQFIDDERYARAFIREKLEINGWGKAKIRYHLRRKGLQTDMLDAFNDPESAAAYTRRLDELLVKKLRLLPPDEDFHKKKSRLVRYAASRGFEPGLVYERAERLLRSDQSS